MLIFKTVHAASMNLNSPTGKCSCAKVWKNEYSGFMRTFQKGVYTAAPVNMVFCIIFQNCPFNFVTALSTVTS